MGNAKTLYDGRLKRNRDSQTSVQFQVEARLAQINGWPKASFDEGQLLKINNGDHLRVSESMYSEKSQEWKYTLINDRRIPASKTIYTESELIRLTEPVRKAVILISDDDIWDNLSLWAGALH